MIEFTIMNCTSGKEYEVLVSSESVGFFIDDVVKHSFEFISSRKIDVKVESK